MSDLHNTLACGHPWSDHNAHGCTDMYCHCKVPGRELKNQELPPLELTQEERTKAEGMAKAILESGAPLDCIESYVLHVYARERQLSAALNELKAKDERFAYFQRLACEQHERDVQEIAAKDTELAAKEARIAELERKGGEVCAVLGNLGIHIHDLGLRPTEPGWQFRNARAEAAEKSLCAVSEVLKEKLPESIQWGEAYWYRALEVDERNRRLRSIVEGK